MVSAASARALVAAKGQSGPDEVVINSRLAGPGVMFVGLPGSAVHGGAFAPQALAGGAWGVLTGPEHAEAAAAAANRRQVVLAAEDPLQALQSLATAWRRHLGARVIGVTGSTGKTSTKDLIHSLVMPQRRTVASRANFNTEIGLPLEICNAAEDTEVLVLEMGMRGSGQISELAQIAEPDVAVIVSLGPVHLELLGSIEAIAAAKAELIAGLRAGGTAIIPADEPLLEPHLRSDLNTITFGPDGDVRVLAEDREHMELDLRGEHLTLEVPFTQAHLRRNLLAAVAAAHAIGITPSGRVEYTVSAGRGARIQLPGGITVIDDCYNANPMSMRAALEDLALSSPPSKAGRRLAVLGDMRELGPDEHRFHEEAGRDAERAGVDLLITVGQLAVVMAHRYNGEVHAAADAVEAAAVVRERLRPGDTVLVKGSRGVGLERVVQALCAEGPA